MKKLQTKNSEDVLAFLHKGLIYVRHDYISKKAQVLLVHGGYTSYEYQNGRFWKFNDVWEASRIQKTGETDSLKRIRNILREKS